MVVFATNAVAIVPLSNILAHATECIATDLGDAVGALMNISFGNLVEIIMFFAALRRKHALTTPATPLYLPPRTQTAFASDITVAPVLTTDL